MESKGVGKWNRKLMFSPILGCFVCCVVIALCLLLSGFNGGNMGKTQTEADSLSGQGMVFLRHKNVSRNEIYSLAALFSDSDQVTSFECHKEPESGLGTKTNSGITCALKLRSGKPEITLRRHRCVAELVKSESQCSIQDEAFPWNLQPYGARTAPVYKDPELSTLQSMDPNHYEKGHHVNLSSYLRNGLWWCLLLGVLVFRKLLSCLHEETSEKTLKMPLRLPWLPWRKKFLSVFVFAGTVTSIWLFWHLNEKLTLRRTETLANMCDERARMLQDQFNVSMNHVHALAVLASTFHHGKHPSAIDQKTFGEYTERTNFERPLTSGVAYALKVPHSDREQIEKEHGWTIKQMESEDQTLVQDCVPESLDAAPIQDEYAPVIFAQETVSHIVSIDMMSGKEDRENILRARATGKGVLTSPFKLLKSNHLGVVLTFAVYNTNMTHYSTEEERIKATMGYLGASYDVPSLVDKLLHQLSSKQTISVNVYDTTNASAPIRMYGSEIGDESHRRISSLDFGDPSRKHEMHCRFKQKPLVPWSAIIASGGLMVITLLLGHIFYVAINRIARVEEDCHKMMELKVRAEAADVAKSQFLATVSHEIRTPMNGVLGMLKMLMDTDLDTVQMDYTQTAHDSGKDLISLMNEVLDQAKIESGRLELENVPFDPRFVLDNVLSLLSGKANEKGIELAVYVSNQVPDAVIGDPGRFRQIITNLVGNSIKFTQDKGHILVSVHLADEVKGSRDIEDEVLKQRLGLVHKCSNEICNTFSGSPVVNASRSWRNFRTFYDTDSHGPDKIELLVTVEDTGIGIPLDAQSRIFTPFMQADSSTSRTYGGTGIGLSISKRLVELMQGEIGFVSERGIGSTFSFTGIFGKAEANASVMKWDQYDLAVKQFRGMRALVIDIRRIRAEVTKYHLQKLGISIDIASSLRTACAKSGNFSMVLIDKDTWNEEHFTEFDEFLKRGEIDSEIFLLATAANHLECVELKSSGLVDDIVMKPLRASVLIGCLQQALGNNAERHRKKKGNLGNLLREKRVLVVDDNLVNRRVAEGALKKYGAVVTCVDSGKAALRLLTPPHSFDACFMDLRMPEMDGFEATRRTRKLEKEFNMKIALADKLKNTENYHIPILAMTADVSPATNEECTKCGMDGFVSKPFEEEELYKAVASFLSVV